MADKIRVWFDAEGDFLEVHFPDAAGYEKHEAVMERVDAVVTGEAEGIWLQKLPDKVILRHLHCRNLGAAGISDHPLGAEM